jgi:hypothetical protein
VCVWGGGGQGETILTTKIGQKGAVNPSWIFYYFIRLHYYNKGMLQ